MSNRAGVPIGAIGGACSDPSVASRAPARPSPCPPPARRLRHGGAEPDGRRRLAAAQPDPVSTVLMLLIIVPVMALTVLFAWRYRAATRRRATTRLGPFDRARAGDLVGAAADHHRARRGHLDQHAPARSLSAAGRIAPGQAGRRRAQAARGRGGGARLEMAVHLPRTRASRPSTSWRCRSIAGPLPDHLATGDELLLRADARRPDLRHAGHGDEAARRAQHARRLRGLFRQLQRRGLLRHAFPVHGHERRRFRPLGRAQRVRPAGSTAPPISSSPSRARRCR